MSLLGLGGQTFASNRSSLDAVGKLNSQSQYR